MTTIQGGTLLVTLEGRDANLSQVIARAEAQMQKGAQSARTYDTQLAALSSNTRRGEAAQAAYAQSLARTASAAGNDAQAVKILAEVMQKLTPNTTAANNVLTQLQATLNKQAAAANQAATAQQRLSQQIAAGHATTQQQISGISSAISGLQKLVGAYFAVTAAANIFTSAIQAGNALEKADATFRALSGSTEAYQKNIAAARDQQTRFGGSLNENIDGLSSFANLSKRTGIEIKELAELARGLAVIDPVQGLAS